MAKQVNVTINGIKITVPEGMLVVDAAKVAGIDIPVFCYHPKMEPVGMCRQCLVDIGRPMIDRGTGQAIVDDHGNPKLQFMPKPETACTNPVVEGMVVYTESEKAKTGQKQIIELLLTNHPLDCPVCDKGGECPLQNLTVAFGSSESRFDFADKQRADKSVPLGELIFLDRERCIQCARCIRFQKDIAGEPVLGFYQRGRATDIVTYSEPGFDSIFSGNTTDICPVGALTTADFRFGARPWEMKHAASVCSQCPVGCNVTFNVRREAKSGGGYAIKRAMPRQNEQVNEIWMCDKGRFAGYHFTESAARLTEAADPATLKLAADKLAEAKADALILASGRLANEDLFNLKKLADGLGGKALLHTTMGGGEYTTRYGLTAGSNLGDLGNPRSGAGGSTILVAASDIHDEAPVWYLRIKAAAKRGATVIVANARATKLDEFATYVVRYAYGDEVETVNGLAGKEKIGDALKAAENLVVFYGSDGLSAAGSAALAGACAELVKARAGKPNNGLVGVWSRANEQGAYELGFRPALDLKNELKDKVVYIAGVDLASEGPEYGEILKHARFVIVQDVLNTETAKLAGAVLPVLAYTEREGTYTSGERRVQRFYPAVPGRAGLKADYALTAEVAKLAGIELEGRAASLVMNHIAAAEGAFAGVDYAKLAEVTEQYPIVGRGDLYYGGTGYENKRGLGVHLALSTTPKFSSERRGGLRPKEGALIAVPVSKVYDMGTTMTSAKLLAGRVGEPSVAVNPATAAKLGVHNGGQVKVSLNGAEAQAKVRFDESISTGVVLVYRSFGIPISEPTAVEISIAEKA